MTDERRAEPFRMPMPPGGPPPSAHHHSLALYYMEQAGKIGVDSTFTLQLAQVHATLALVAQNKERGA